MNLKLLTFLLIVLSFRFYFFHYNQLQFMDGQRVSFETTILSQPQIVGNRQVFSANYQNQKFKITTSHFPELSYGDSVRIYGPIRVLSRDGGFQPRALAGQPYGVNFISNIGDRPIMYSPKIEILEDKSFLGTSLKVINNLRQKIISLFSRTLPSPSSSLLLGIIFGIKEQMPKDFADNLRTTGIFHVIAASGMNVTLIGGFISVFFAFFLKRQIALGLSIVGIILYAILAGLEASIIRASVMGIIVFSAQIMGRQTLAVNGLFLAGFAMLFVNPSLISDIGFQLSFTATLGILYIDPILDKNKKVKLIAQKSVIGVDVLTTVAAQLATLPILLANFGTYSLYSILVNGLILWTVPIVMAIGGMGALIGLIFAPLGQLIIYFCYPLLIYFEKIVQVFGKIGGVITIQTLSWQFIAGYYCLLSSILLILKRKK